MSAGMFDRAERIFRNYYISAGSEVLSLKGLLIFINKKKPGKAIDVIKN